MWIRADGAIWSVQLFSRRALRPHTRPAANSSSCGRSRTMHEHAASTKFEDGRPTVLGAIETLAARRRWRFDIGIARESGAAAHHGSNFVRAGPLGLAVGVVL